MERPELKHAIDRALYGIECPEGDIRQVLAMAKGEPVMKRKVSMSLVVALVLVLAIGATALAIGFGRSTSNEAIRVARDALITEYGHTHETLGVFDEKAESDGGKWTIEFKPNYYNVAAIGKYEATVEGGKATSITWTHDGEEIPNVDAGLDVPVWGPQQIERAMNLQREHTIELYTTEQPLPTDSTSLTGESAARDAGLMAEGDLGITVNVTPGPADIQEDEAVEKALNTIHETYGVPMDELEGYEIIASLNSNPSYRWYSIIGMNEDSGYFHVMFDTPSGDMMTISWNIDPENRLLPEGDLAGYEKAVKEFVGQGAFELLPVEKKADVSERILAAGYGEYIENRLYVAPEDGDIPADEGLKAANDALLEKYGVTEDMLVLFERKTGLIAKDDARSWLAEYTPKRMPYWGQDIDEHFGTYTVLIDARNGEVNDITWSLDDVKLEKAYTKSNWASAPAWNGEILQWTLEFHNAQMEIEDKYAGQISTLREMEDEVARDQLFRDAGFTADEVYYRRGLPTADEIQKDEAIQIAKSALMEDYGLPAEEVDALSVFPEFYVNDPEHHEWYIMLQDLRLGGRAGYEVRIDGSDGTILETKYSVGGEG